MPSVPIVKFSTHGQIVQFQKARPVRSPSAEPPSPVGVWKGTTRQTVTYNEVMTAEAATKHPVVFRCLNKVATAVSAIDWRCEYDPKVKQNERPPQKVINAINDMIADPNDAFAADQMRYWMALTFACFGRIPFKVGIGTEKLPNGMYPLDARYVKAILNDRGMIDQYQYGVDKTTLPARRKVTPDPKKGPQEPYVYEIITPGLSGTAEHGANISALNAIGLPAQVISLLLRRAADTASGHPNTKYIVAAEKTLTKTQRKSLTERIEEGETGDEESGNILFLYNTKVEILKLDNDLSDIHSKMPMDDMARHIAGIFGVPISLLGLGAADGAKFAGNYVESRRSFYEDTIIPGYCSPIATGMTTALCPYGARIVFDLDSIPALGDVRVARAKELSKVDFLDADEKRALCGFPPRKTTPTE